ncbi:MAG TPA: choice-of-anchor P family protein [Mycobacteriales bacterium]|jgi:hypothetical protein|nr:choice-of-anchor P family protein [Mycobacteriales bacterium]
MAKFNSRGARLTALALATGTLVVAGTGTAGANPVAVPAVFGGTARGTAIHLEINLPQAIPANVPVVGGITSLVQDISFTEGDTSKAPAKVTSVAKAVLGNGNVVLLSDVLGKKVTSSLDGAQTANDAILAQDLGLIKVGVGQITSNVLPDTATTGLTSSSASSLAELHVGLAGLDLPVKDQITEVVNTLNSTVDTANGTVNQALQSAFDVLDGVAQGADAPVVEQVKAVKAQLDSLVKSLQQVLAGVTADTDLVNLSLLKSSENISRAGAMVTSKAVSEVGGLDILGGLVTVDAVKTESVSSANGVKGAAAADTRTTIAHVKVADKLELALTKDGLSGSLLGQDLPAAAQDAVSTVIDTVNGVLSVAGVQIIEGKKTSSVDPNGQFASSSSEGVGIVVNPLHAAKPLVLVQLVPAGTAVNAAQAGKKHTVVTPPKVTTPDEKRTMPRTGAELPLFALFGTGLAGAAVIRRRRTVEA